MSTAHVNRREFLQAGALAAGLAAAAGTAAAVELPRTYQQNISPWPVVMNASTIRPAPLKDKIRVTAEAGYDGIELWINELEEFEKGGGNLKDLGNEIKDRGLFVPNVIGLWNGMPATKEEWDAILPVSRERMRMSAEVGSRRIAALPFPDREDFDIRAGTDQYKELLCIGRDEYGLSVMMEFIGFLKGINRLGEACAMAIDADEPTAAVLPDIFHLFRGGSGFNGIKHLSPTFIGDFHWNDMPANRPPREECGDKHRVMPGDGDLPLTQCLKDLLAIGYDGPLSLELFNEEYWAMDPKKVAEIGLEKMRANIATAFA